MDGCGNFGAGPNPPHSGSNVRAIERSASVRIASVSGSWDSVMASPRESAWVSFVPSSVMRSRRSRQASSIAASTFGNPGRP